MRSHTKIAINIEMKESLGEGLAPLKNIGCKLSESWTKCTTNIRFRRLRRWHKENYWKFIRRMFFLKPCHAADNGWKSIVHCIYYIKGQTTIYNHIHISGQFKLTLHIHTYPHQHVAGQWKEAGVPTQTKEELQIVPERVSICVLFRFQCNSPSRETSKVTRKLRLERLLIHI